MTVIENYEIIISDEEQERLLLSFDWSDLAPTQRAISQVIFDRTRSLIRVTFENSADWLEADFVEVPETLHDLIARFRKIMIIGLSDKVELMLESDLQVNA